MLNNFNYSIPYCVIKLLLMSSGGGIAVLFLLAFPITTNKNITVGFHDEKTCYQQVVLVDILLSTAFYCF